MKREIMIAAAVLLAAPAFAQDAAPAPAPAPAAEQSMQVTDPQQFAEMAAMSNMFEIESSNLAVERAQSQELKDFAQMMIDDHTMAGEKMMAAAEEEGITPPAELDAEHQDKLAQLEAASDEEFDQLYTSMQVEAHEKAVSLFEGFAQGGSGALQSFAANTLPTLQEHYEHITSMSGM